ncbi:hypothetical protein H2201_009066 [Coniosporium apollinis]|uniref:Rhodopsin domain-containing protein n=1 Tax=Coniosporium apollinis TaxID=61459 RepID=A0ABQ9NL74_9PEZI|nr:hypothetical protein H2201_009066 [Coniosporium apollinis]
MGDSIGSRFARESWALYATGMLLITSRMLVRIRRRGVKQLQLDDYFTVNAGFWYTLLCVALNQVASGGGSNYMTDEEIAQLTPESIKERVIGSKWVIVSEQGWIVTIWSLKACMLLIYLRLTTGLSQRRIVNAIAIYVAAGFVACQLALFLSCRPFHHYWAVPAPEPQCSTYSHYLLTNAVLNISSDICMLLVGLPLIFTVQLALPQKIVLGIIFGMGIFVVAASVVTKIFCLVPALVTADYIFWYFRETTVALYVTNIPLMWPLLLDYFPAFRKWLRKSRTSADTDKDVGSGLSGSKHSLGQRLSQFTRKPIHTMRLNEFPLESFKHGDRIHSEDCEWNPKQSQERIVSSGEKPSGMIDGQSSGIKREVVVTIDHSFITDPDEASIQSQSDSSTRT